VRDSTADPRPEPDDRYDAPAIEAREPLTEPLIGVSSVQMM
jgi:hypothetical protein